MYNTNTKAQTSTYVVFGLFVLVVIILMELNLSWKAASLGVLASIGFLFAFIKTDFALVILVMSMLLSPEFKAGSIADRSILVRIEDMFIIVVFLGWLAKMAVNKELGLLKRTPLNTPIILYMGVCLVSSLVGINWGVTQPERSLFYLLKYFEYFFLYFLVINNLKDVRQMKIYVRCILFTAVIVCVAVWFLTPHGARLSTPFQKEGGEPNTLSGYLLLMMGLISGLLLYPGLGPRIIYGALLVFAAIPFLLTLSRGGWLGFFPMFLTFIVVSKQYRLQLTLALLILLACLPFALPKSVYERVNVTFHPEMSTTILGTQYKMAESAAARINTWYYGVKLWLKSPLIGHGVPTGSVIDNQYARVIIETGILGFGCFLWIIALIIQQCLRVFKKYPDKLFHRGISIGLLAGLVGLLFHALSSASFIIIRIMEPFWFLVAVVVSLPMVEEQSAG